METIQGNNIPTETLTGVSSSAPHIPMKPTTEELFGTDLGSENGDGASVVATTVVETTEVTVVKIVEENKDDTFTSQEGETFADSVSEKIDNNNDSKENEKEGVFGHLFEGDEGTNVNSNNETKTNEKEEVFGHLFDGDEGMDVDYNNEAEENEKTEVFGNLFNGDEGINVNFTENGNEEKLVINEHEENTGADLMDVCLSNQKEENTKNFTQVFEFTEDMNENKNGENGEGDVSKLAENYESGEEEEKHDYVVGDFVWGKIKSHPWWPGQIYDPSNASDYANSIKRKGHLLVAYFGDGSFSWCSPSQLKPFIDHFQEMSTQSDSKKFVHAVRTALEEVGNLVETELTCKCQPVDRADVAVNADVANGGIKPGVRAPKGNTIKTLIEKLNPVELLLNLNAYAVFEPGSRAVDLELDLTMVKSWLSVFYLQKGGYVLPEYYDPKCIEGLEDNSSRNGNVAETEMNGPENGDDKLYQKRKQKSVAELLSVEDEPKIKKAKTVKDSGSGRKRKAAAALVVDVSEPPESDHESGGGGGGVGEEDSMCSPRQRRKSKYLSPPYLSPIWTAKVSGSGSNSFKEPKEQKPEPEKEQKVLEMAAKKLEEGSRKKPRQKRRSVDNLKEDGKVVIDGNVSVDKVLDGLLIVALDPSGNVEKKKLGVVSGFVSSFRSSVFENGSKFQPDLKMEVEEETEAETDLGFVKRKMEEMKEVVDGMSEEVKGRLEGIIMEVLERVK